MDMDLPQPVDLMSAPLLRWEMTMSTKGLLDGLKTEDKLANTLCLTLDLGESGMGTVGQASHHSQGFYMSVFVC